MYEHQTFVTAAYLAATVILTWCALAPVFRIRRVKERLARSLSRTHGQDRA